MNTKKKEITLESGEGYSIKVCSVTTNYTDTVWVEYHDEHFKTEIDLGDCKMANEVAQAILEICK